MEQFGVIILLQFGTNYIFDPSVWCTTTQEHHPSDNHKGFGCRFALYSGSNGMKRGDTSELNVRRATGGRFSFMFARTSHLLLFK